MQKNQLYIISMKQYHSVKSVRLHRFSFTEGRNPMDVGRILITLLACAVTVYRIVSDDE